MQIAESVGGRRPIVAPAGSAHTEAELGVLVERARELLEAPGQGDLELGWSRSRRGCRCWARPARRRCSMSAANADRQPPAEESARPGLATGSVTTARGPTATRGMTRARCTGS